jgi:glycosyltransferase involved in cell wall biosynthesis
MRLSTQSTGSRRLDRALRLGFVTIHAAEDQSAYSGTAFAMRQAFREHPEVDLFEIDRLAVTGYPLWRAKQAAYWFGLGRRYWMNRQPAVLHGFAKQVAQKAATIGRLDCLVSPSSIPMAAYRGAEPTVFWTDATFDCLADFYPEATGFCTETRRAGNAQERAALDGCRLALYSSQWAVNSAIRSYGINPAKLAVVPYGANAKQVPSTQEIPRLVAGRCNTPLRLLFVGVDWARKGGPLAIATAEEIHRRGINVAIDLVGATTASQLSNVATFHGFLSKDREADVNRLDDLFRRADVFILPTRADCVPMVIAEACAYGLPVVATAVGGVGTVVEDGATGRLMPAQSGPGEWADAVLGLAANREAYASTSHAARRLYDRFLNWPTAVQTVVRLLRESIEHKHAA